MSTAKRVFERGGLFLCDRVVDPGTGRMLEEFIPFPEDALPQEVRLSALQMLASNETVCHSQAILALAWDTSPLTLDALLDAAARGSAAAALQLTRVGTDDRAAPAVLAGARRTASAVELGNFAEAIARLGIQEGIPLLERALASLESDSTLLVAGEAMNGVALAVTRVAGALLRLGRYPARCVGVLRRVLDHPVDAVRVVAAREFAAALATLSTDVVHSDLQLIEALLSSGEGAMMAAVGPSLFHLRPDMVLAECRRYFAGSNDERSIAIGVLTRADDSRAREALLEYLPTEQDPRRAAEIANVISGLVPPAELRRVALSCIGDPSPVTRLMALSLFRDLNKTRGREMALHALADEPDSLIRHALGKDAGVDPWT